MYESYHAFMSVYGLYITIAICAIIIFMQMAEKKRLKQDLQKLHNENQELKKLGQVHING